MYNHAQVCCNPSFEEEMVRAMDIWQTNLAQVIEDIQDFRDAVSAIPLTEAYADAGTHERNSLDVALKAFDPVLRLYGLCFDTMLAYIAGLLCFACDPDWEAALVMDGVHAIGYEVDPSTFDALWNACQVWSGYAQTLEFRVKDSALGKRLPLPFPDLSPFMSESALANYMQVIGLRVILPDADLVPAKGPVGRTPVTRRLSYGNASGNALTLVEPSRYLDLVAMGLASEFETRVFPIEKDAFVAGASVASFLAGFLVSGLRF
jgi:hypothetical protein